MKQSWARVAIFQRNAFTLVELLVVIAIIGILIGLLLPAVQAAREAARRMQCGNNLKQLMLANLNYHDTYGQFVPNGAFKWSGNLSGNDYKGSYFLRLLPFIEQSGLYGMIDFNRNPEVYGVLDVASRKLVSSVLMTSFICPSDPDTNESNPFPNGGRSGIRNAAPANYGFSMGNQMFLYCGPGGNMFGTGPTNNGDSMNPNNISGPFSSMYWSANLRDITDGTSNTIGMGEVRPKCAWHMADGWMHVNSFWVGTTGGINTPTCPGEPGWSEASGSCNHQGSAALATWGMSQSFKSMHPGGAQFALCDGSVRFLPQAIDYVTYQRLGDRRDGGALGGF